MQEAQDGSAKQSTTFGTNINHVSSTEAGNPETTEAQLQDALEVLKLYEGKTPSNSRPEQNCLSPSEGEIPYEENFSASMTSQQLETNSLAAKSEIIHSNTKPPSVPSKKHHPKKLDSDFFSGSLHDQPIGPG